MRANLCVCIHALTRSATRLYALDGCVCRNSTTSAHRPGTLMPLPDTSSAARRRYLQGRCEEAHYITVSYG